MKTFYSYVFWEERTAPHSMGFGVGVTQKKPVECPRYDSAELKHVSGWSG